MSLSIPDGVSAQMQALVNAYAAQLEQYQSPSYNETEVRVDFINPLFQLLGWDVGNAAGLPQHLREVTHEATVSVEEPSGLYRSKKPDYSFKVGTETRFFLETKKPSVDLTTDRAPAFQLRRYGWSGNLSVSVLSNFTDLYLYDCSVRPIEGDDVGTALLAHYHFTEYVSRLPELYGLLSRQAVLSGALDAQFRTSPFRREPFNAYFLQQIQSWRLQLGEDVLRNNPGADAETLNLCVQRILNRTIFLRICEDRMLEPYGALRSVTGYEDLKARFFAADRKYDSGLFECLEEDRLTLSDETICAILSNLYYPNSSYEFSVIDPYLIGQIYELFLEKTLVLRPDGTLAAAEKPEAVEAQGVVNTPKNLADIIVEQTLQPLCEGRTPEETASYRIADICCGSGNFLLSALEYLVNFHMDYERRTDLDGALRRGDLRPLPGSGNYGLSYTRKRWILEHNLFGVDIDPLAVEVCKFSLLLKILENTSIQELTAYQKRTHSRILPNLDDNLKRGNALLDSTYLRLHPDAYEDVERLNKLCPFDWDAEFNGQKFDAIIGNPPYIRVQNLIRYAPEEYAFYKNPAAGYETAQAETLDCYYLFLERGLSLLTERGVLGYIIPHKFMTIQSGEPLRKFLSQRQAVRKLLHFGSFQAFADRSTYTCILLLSKRPQKTFALGFVRDWNQFLCRHTAACADYPADALSEQPWVFLPPQLTIQLNRIAPRCSPLLELAEVFVGVQTSADKIYILHADREDDAYIYGQDKDGQPVQVERGLLRKSVYDARLVSYEPIEANCYLIFPYQNQNGRPVLYTPEEMETQFPHGLAYLRRFRPELDRRKMAGRTEENWYAYGRSQSLRRFLVGEHLLWPVLSLGANYVYDNEQVVFTGGGNGPFYGLERKPNTPESIFYLQAVLNHWLPELLVRSRASTFRGGYYSHGKQFVETLPICRIDFQDPAQKAAHDDIVVSVQTLMRLSVQRKQAPNNARRTVIERSCAAVKRELSGKINALYEVQQKDEGIYEIG